MEQPEEQPEKQPDLKLLVEADRRRRLTLAEAKLLEIERTFGVRFVGLPFFTRARDGSWEIDIKIGVELQEGNAH